MAVTFDSISANVPTILSRLEAREAMGMLCVDALRAVLTN